MLHVVIDARIWLDLAKDYPEQLVINAFGIWLPRGKKVPFCAVYSDKIGMP